MKLPKLKVRKKPNKTKSKCEDKIELALKEIENLTQEAKDFFVVENKKDEKDGRDK